MEQPVVKPNPTKLATKWAFINLIAGIIITYAIQYSGADSNGPAKYVGYLPFIAFLLLTQKEFKDQLGGYLTFGEGFSAGFRYALFSGILTGIFTYLYLVVLNPEVFAKGMEEARAQMEAKNMSSEQIDQALKITKTIGAPITAFVVAVLTTIVGIVIALIGAAIFKRERSAFDPDTNTDPAV